MKWQKIILNNQQVMAGHLEYISNQCLPIMVKHHKPKLQSPSIGESDKNNNTAVYFSPEIIPFWGGILSKYGSVSCEAPDEETTPMVRINQP